MPQARAVVAGDVAVGARLDLGRAAPRRRPGRARSSRRRRGPPSACGGCASSTSPLNLPLEPALGRLHRAVVEPAHHARARRSSCSGRSRAVPRSRPLSASRFSVVSGISTSWKRSRRSGSGSSLVAGARQRLLVERVDVDDHHAAGPHVVDVRAQRGRVEGDQHVGLVGGRVDVVGSRSGSGSPRRPASVPAGARISAGKSGNVDRSLPARAVVVGELRAGELHAVAGITGESDGDALELFGRLGLLRIAGCHAGLSRLCSTPPVSASVGCVGATGMKPFTPGITAPWMGMML